MRIFLIGFMGSGKSHWGRQISTQMKIPYFDLDEQIVDAEGLSIPDIFARYGEEYFRMKEKDVLETLIDEHASVVISTGGGTPCFFNNIELMKKKGTVVWLNTHVEVLLQRLLREKTKRPLIKDIADEDLKNYIIRKLNERRMYYQQSDLTVDNENSISPAEFIQTIMHV